MTDNDNNPLHERIPCMICGYIDNQNIQYYLNWKLEVLNANKNYVFNEKIDYYNKTININIWVIAIFLIYILIPPIITLTL